MAKSVSINDDRAAALASAVIQMDSARHSIAGAGFKAVAENMTRHIEEIQSMLVDGGFPRAPERFGK